MSKLTPTDSEKVRVLNGVPGTAVDTVPSGAFTGYHKIAERHAPWRGPATNSPCAGFGRGPRERASSLDTLVFLFSFVFLWWSICSCFVVVRTLGPKSITTTSRFERATGAVGYLCVRLPIINRATRSAVLQDLELAGTLDGAPTHNRQHTTHPW